MKAKLLLRIASLVMLLHTIGHTFGALGWKKAPNDAVAKVIIGMQTNHFEFMGRSATLANFYEGYGIIMILVLLFVSLMLWFLSTAPTIQLVTLSGIFLVTMAVAEYIYFFPFAAIISLTAGVCTLTALKVGKKTST